MSAPSMAAATEPARPRFKMPRIPGDIMIYPMVIGLALNTFAPQVLDMGGFTTAVARQGTSPLVAAILLFIGAGLDFKTTPRAIKTGLAILVPKLAACIAIGLAVAFFFDDDLLGLSSVSIIGGISFCNVALYTGIMGEYGDEAEQGAVGVLCFTIGPTITMIALGAAGLADIPVGTLMGSLLPLVLGMVLGNCFPFMRGFLPPGQNPCIMVVGFALGCGMSLEDFVGGGISGLLLSALCLAIGVLTFAFDRLCGGTGKAGAACATVAGTAMMTPVAMAAVSERYAALQGAAAAQIAVAVIVTAFVAPVVTGWVDERFCGGRGAREAAEVEAAELEAGDRIEAAREG